MVRRTPQKSEKPKKFETKKSLGQHFLNNSRIPELMAEAGEVHPGDVVLEVGPGTGALTRVLLDRNATVVALEADQRAISVLEHDFAEEIAAQKLIILHIDARALDLATLHPLIRNGRYKVIANIPYYLSGHLFRTFLETDTQPTDLVFLVQKEVALRIAREKKESLLSLSVKVYGTPIYVKTVGKGNFTPPPKIDSAIIAIRDISKEQFAQIDETQFFLILHAGFAGKRKQLAGNLSTHFPKDKVLKTLSTLGVRPDVRGEDLSLTTWLDLVRHLTVRS